MMDISTRNGRTGAPVLMLLVVALAGCGKKELPLPPSAPPAAIEPAAPADPTIVPQAELSGNQRLARVVTLLNAGDEPTARAELAELLRQEPGRREAEVLRQSIEGDPRAMVPRDSFAYVVRPGDTFVTLALEYLRDSYKFYALARINGVTPNALKPGDIVQIPGRFRERAEPRRTTPPSSPRPGAVSPRPGTTVAPTAPSTPQSDPAAARRMRRAGLEAMSAGRIDVAVTRLSRAAQLDPGDGAIAADLARARRIQSTVRSRN